MSIKIRCVILLVLIVCVFIILNMVRKKTIDLRYALGWLFFCFLLLVLDAAPQLLVLTSNMLGIISPINMLFFLAFLFSIMLIFGLTVALSRLSLKTKRLTQELALLKNNMDMLNNPD